MHDKWLIFILAVWVGVGFLLWVAFGREDLRALPRFILAWLPGLFWGRVVGWMMR